MANEKLITFEDLKRPPYSDNATIRHAMEYHMQTNASEQDTLLIIIQVLRETNSRQLDLLLNIHKPIVYQTNDDKVRPR